MENIGELFTAPIGLDVVANVEGYILYGSDSLNRNFLKSLEKTSSIRPIFKTIKKLVNNGIIVPCWLNKSIFKLIKFKLWGDASRKTIVAFYHYETKKIYVMIDNNINAFGYSSNQWLATVVVHELLHLFSMKHPELFFKLYKKILEKFYSSMFKKLFQLINYPDTKRFTKFLFKLEQKNRIASSDLQIYYDTMMKFKTLSALNEDKYIFIANRLITCLKVRHISFKAWFNTRGKYGVVLRSIRDAYYDLIGPAFNNIQTGVYQELDVPTEVICVLSEAKHKYTSSILKGLNSL